MKYAVHRTTVSRILHDSGVATRGPQLNPERAVIDQVIGLREAGANWRYIEQQVGFSRHALSHLLTRLGYESLASRHSSVPLDIVSRIRELRETGQSTTQIAQVLQFDPKKIRRIIAQEGL